MLWYPRTITEKIGFLTYQMAGTLAEVNFEKLFLTYTRV